MEEKVSMKNNGTENENKEVREKDAKLSEVGRVFIESDSQEDDQSSEKEILAYPDTVASHEAKQALLKARRKADSIVKPTDDDSSLGARENRKGMKKAIQRNISPRENNNRREQVMEDNNNKENIEKTSEERQ